MNANQKKFLIVGLVALGGFVAWRLFGSAPGMSLKNRISRKFK